MPGKKPPPAWEVILEEILSQNRATIEAVQSTREELKREIAEQKETTDAGLQTLAAAVRQNGTEIQVLQGDVRILQGDVRILQGDVRILQRDVRTLADRVEHLDEKVDALTGLEARVSVLERQRG
jgi:chaperonin cofactor prefoldin